jgi:hypothetical protein
MPRGRSKKVRSCGTQRQLSFLSIALAPCVYQAKEDDDFHSDDVKVISNWGEEEKRMYERCHTG